MRVLLRTRFAGLYKQFAEHCNGDLVRQLAQFYLSKFPTATVSRGHMKEEAFGH